MTHLIGYVLVGVVIGFLSGLFGVGGSSVSTPILKMLFALPDRIALASPLPVTIPTALAGAYSYWRRGLVRKDVALWATLGGMPGVIAGALGTKVVSGLWLMSLTGAFVLAVGLRLLVRDKGPAPGGLKGRLPIPLTAALVGLLVGFLSGLLANGGGFLLVPAFVLLLGLSMQEAASTSLICVAFYAIPGTLVHWWLGNINWPLVLALSIGVSPAGYLGSRLGLMINGDRTRTAFGLFLAIFGLDFVLQQFGLRGAVAYALLAVAVVVAALWVALGLLTRGGRREPGPQQP